MANSLVGQFGKLSHFNMANSLVGQFSKLSHFNMANSLVGQFSKLSHFSMANSLVGQFGKLSHFCATVTVWPLAPIRNQTCFDRIVDDVANNPFPLSLIAHIMIIAFVFPKTSSAIQKKIGFSCSAPLK